MARTAYLPKSVILVCAEALGTTTLAWYRQLDSFDLIVIRQVVNSVVRG